MLRELSIRNFALIDTLNISLGKGLTIFSGETGAGKSIIINAINLILGSRASANLIRFGEETSTIEAVFEIPKTSKVYQLLRESGYDVDDELLIRRVISNKDRHKVYINGSQATIQVLFSTANTLANIASQHAQQALLKQDQHLYFLDQFGGFLELRNQVEKTYKKFIPLIQQMNQLIQDRSVASQNAELLRHQRDEILQAEIAENEDLLLEKERKILQNSQDLLLSITNCIGQLYENKGAVFEQLGDVKRALQKWSDIDSTLNRLAHQFDEILYQVEDGAQELAKYQSQLNLDENRLSEIEKRLHTIAKLKRKYGGSLAAIDNYLQEFTREINGLENLDEKIENIRSEIDIMYHDLIGQVRHLSKKRNKAAQLLSLKIEEELGLLKMPDTRFVVRLENTIANNDVDPYLVVDDCVIHQTGIDRSVFEIAPNLGEELKPIHQIASGGELSRIFLALKTILAKNDSVSTIIFDEVDAGIGGGVAELVGKKLKLLSKYHQVICITHLPQIAKFADHHFKISKSVDGTKTQTKIAQLEFDEQVEEIARMLGGEQMTQKTLSHAKEMIEKNH